MGLFSQLRPQKSHDHSQGQYYRQLIQREAIIGGQLFGRVAEGGRREFFCLDEHTWVWHEEWTDNSGKRRIVTTRYDVRPNGVLKAQDGQGYQYINIDEARNLFQAVGLYKQRVSSEVYGLAV
ncbi:MAG: hypothetical protein ACREGF_00010 [Candidatus Saccharimonadales bacterium]